MINRRRFRCSGWVAFSFVLALAPWADASDYLFLNKRYIDLTKKVIDQAAPLAGTTFEAGSVPRSKYDSAVEGLRGQLDAVQRARVFKKIKAMDVAQVRDEQFAANLNTFKFGLQAIAQKAGKPLPELLPSYEDWVKTETAVVSRGVDQRLQAFETRFGPDSEQVNFIELFAGEALFRGDEAAPSPWEPIARLSAVQLTTAGPGLVSAFQLGMNHYFVRGEPPAPLRWIGLRNHVGLAATLQYQNDPRLLRFKGRPSFGVALHLDREEVGANWDPDRKTVRVTFGYAFQFVPLLL